MTQVDIRAIGLVLCAFIGGCATSEDSGTTPDGSPRLDTSLDNAADVMGDMRTDLSASDGFDGRDTTPDGLVCRLKKPYSSKNIVCNECAQSNCCDEVNKCRTDTRCENDYVDCTLACALFPDDAGVDATGVDAAGAVAECLKSCGAKFPVGQSLYDAAIGCVERACAVECS